MNIAKKLGFAEDTKFLIIHADDAGLSHSENMATIQLLENGMVNSYSMMVPCPWFYEMAIFSKNNPRFDYGIHLTLTCEWENYKFGPVASISEVPSLVDGNGHFYKNRTLVKENAKLEDVKKELEAQIEKALNLGLKPTHIDSHMFSVGISDEFFQIYRALGKKYSLPIMINRQLMEMVGLNPDDNINDGDLIIDKAHFGIFEYFESDKLSDYYTHIFEKLVCGLNIILIHPAFDDEEMRGITINHPNFGSKWRQIDFDSFSSQENEAKINMNNIKLITWSDLRL